MTIVWRKRKRSTKGQHGQMFLRWQIYGTEAAVDSVRNWKKGNEEQERKGSINEKVARMTETQLQGKCYKALFTCLILVLVCVLCLL
jgi:hypothetical protein